MTTDDASKPYDESEHCKEVYAHFGLAYYESGVIESGIANALLYGEFLMGWKERIQREGNANFDRNLYETEFDAYLENQYSQSLGNLLKRLERIIGIPNELKIVIAEGKRLRDFLAHHYYRERAANFVTRQGRDVMIAELIVMGQKFREIDNHIQTLLVPVKRQLGVSEATLNRYIEKFTRAAYAEEELG